MAASIRSLMRSKNILFCMQSLTLRNNFIYRQKKTDSQSINHLKSDIGRTLYVCNIPPTTDTVNKLKSIFDGAVEVQIKKKNRRGSRYGFVIFKSSDEAKKFLLERRTNLVLDGNKLEIEFATSKGITTQQNSPVSGQQEFQTNPYHKLYVPDVPHFIEEKKFKALFPGAARAEIVTKTKGFRFGIVTYNSVDEAAKALKKTNGKIEVRGKIMSIEYKKQSVNKEFPIKDVVKQSHTFESIQRYREDQAYRSVIIQMNHKDTDSMQGEIDYILDICNKKGHVRHYMTFSVKRNMCFMLVEFDRRDHVENLLQSVDFSRKGLIPMNSRYLLFKPGKRLEEINSQKSKQTTNHQHITGKQTKFSILTLKEEGMDLEKSINVFWEGNKITELDQRLSYFIASTVQEMFSVFHPSCRAKLFGSCVNGFGSVGCDIDIVLTFDEAKKNNLNAEFEFKCSAKMPETDKELISFIHTLIYSLLPYSGITMPILHARVPIIKFSSHLAETECDICVSGSGVKMAELLYTWGQLCEPMKPVVAVVKLWAEMKKISDSGPGSHLTNFMLILMITFYLQTKSFLPSLTAMKEIAENDDVSSFCTNHVTIRQKIELAVPASAGDLLKGFFAFYSDFDFEKCGLSTNLGKSVDKEDYRPLFIENPFDRSLNVSKNVGVGTIRRFVNEIKKANKILESENSQIVLKLVSEIDKEQNEHGTRLLDIRKNRQKPQRLTLSYLNKMNPRNSKMEKLTDKTLESNVSIVNMDPKR